VRKSARRSVVFHIAVAAAIVSACGRDRAVPPADSTARPVFRVALLTPGPISDQAWNGGAYAGLVRIRDSLGASISHVQTRTPAEFEENFRHYGTEGYDLVFGHGFEFQDAAVRVAPDFPKTIFITTSGRTVRPNVAGMAFAFEQGAFLAGMVAGAMTKSGVIGCVGGTELPPVQTAFAAFAAGAKETNPSVRLVVSYLGNWDDVSAGKEQALAQIGRGVDIIFQNADAAGLGVIQAARERHVFVIGANSDQNGLAPDVMLGSVVIDLPHALLTVAREVKEKRFVPRVVTLGAEREVVAWTPNPQVAGQIPQAIMARVSSVHAQMRAGTFAVPGLNVAPQ
jgi:basic membrane protein A